MTDENSRCERCARPMVAFVGCGQQKHDEPQPARQLYTSNYFQLKRQFAETVCDYWQIISAKHECLSPADEIAPYDLTLSDLSPYEQGRWAERTQAQMECFLSFLNPNATVYVLMGEAYAEHFTSLWAQIEQGNHGAVVFPFRETSGIGEQMAWLREQIDETEQRRAFAETGTLQPVIEQ